MLLCWVCGRGGGPLTGGWSGFRVWLLRWWVAGRAGLGGGQGDRTVPVAVSLVRLGMLGVLGVTAISFGVVVGL